MDVLVSNSRGTLVVPIKTKLLKENRTVFIENEITSLSADEFKHTIMYLIYEDAEKPINIHIDSPGGSVQAGLMIYDIIKGLSVDVNVYCTGIAASMAAIIFAGAEKGHRFILPHSKVMIHEPLIYGGVGGSATSIQKTAESIMETKRIAVELLSEDTGKSKEEIEKAISFDNFMNAQEAIKFGIADKIVYTVF